MKGKIKLNVIAYIASFANMPSNDIQDNYILKDHPLRLDDTTLAFLTISLRGYLKSLNENKTILVSELRKKDLTVKKTYELIIEKAGL